MKMAYTEQQNKNDIFSKATLNNLLASHFLG